MRVFDGDLSAGKDSGARPKQQLAAEVREQKGEGGKRGSGLKVEILNGILFVHVQLLNLL